jgi:hypothetical protein
MEEHSSLLNEGRPPIKSVPIADLVQAREVFFVWTLVAYIAWGVAIELYTNFFYDVIDQGSWSSVSLYTYTCGGLCFTCWICER